MKLLVVLYACWRVLFDLKIARRKLSDCNGGSGLLVRGRIEKKNNMKLVDILASQRGIDLGLGSIKWTTHSAKLSDLNSVVSK